MTSNRRINSGRSINRREFARKAIIAIAAAGAAGLTGYVALDSKRLRTVNNYRRMGHCAPSVMQTLLDINSLKNENLVLTAGGLAGGIAGSDMECGVLTAPLMFLSHIAGNQVDVHQELEMLSKARSYINAFNDFNGTTICSRIRQEGMPACTKCVGSFYRIYSSSIKEPVNLAGETYDSIMFLLKTFEKEKFHCAHNVLNNIKHKLNVAEDIFSSSRIFAGGIAMLNRTCDALTAGVMTLSSVTSKLEDSYSRVAKMNKMLRQKDPDAMDEEINNFNRSINLSEELGFWFRNEFGSTNCSEIWRLNFSKLRDAETFVSGNCMIQCRYIAKKVAEKVIAMI